MLYSVVLQDLGSNVLKRGAWSYMQYYYLNTSSDVNIYFTSNNPISQQAIDLLFSDPYYGLNDIKNYHRWEGFSNDNEPVL